MATHIPSTTPSPAKADRLALRPDRAPHADGYGAWWPQSRNLGDELPGLLAQWPADAGHVSRVLYSPPDWDDRPRKVTIPGRSAPLKTGSFPADDTQRLVLTLLDGTRRVISVIPPETTDEVATARLRGVSGDAG